MKTCIVIPAYNEENRIRETLDNFAATILKKYGKEIILLIVSEGSTDNTNRIVRSYMKKYSEIKILSGNRREGKGGALVRGFKIAIDKYKPQIVGFVDADPSVSGQEIIRLLSILESRGVDGVIASRYMKESKLVGDLGKMRFLASRSYNVMVRVLFGINFFDTQCGAKFFKAWALSRILKEIKLTDLSFDINLLYELSRHKFRIIEVPITYRAIQEGTKVRVSKQIPKMFIVTLGYRFTKSRFNRLVSADFKGKVYHMVKKW